MYTVFEAARSSRGHGAGGHREADQAGDRPRNPTQPNPCKVHHRWNRTPHPASNKLVNLCP